MNRRRQFLKDFCGSGKFFTVYNVLWITLFAICFVGLNGGLFLISGIIIQTWMGDLGEIQKEIASSITILIFYIILYYTFVLSTNFIVKITGKEIKKYFVKLRLRHIILSGPWLLFVHYFTTVFVSKTKLLLDLQGHWSSFESANAVVSFGLGFASFSFMIGIVVKFASITQLTAVSD